MLRRDPAQPWHPSYWLASLGAGGLSVSFFMYLMWLVPHPGFPVPTWQHLETVLSGQASLPSWRACRRTVGYPADVTAGGTALSVADLEFP